MEKRSVKVILLSIAAAVFSCNEPETTVINIIHPDGSVTRRIEMRNSRNEFNPARIQVPFDTTWVVRDSLELNDKGDTTWVKRAEKFFCGYEEINREYLCDSGSNRKTIRRVEFSKKFRWFSNKYRFAEIIERQFSHGYPLKDFLDQEEIEWFYSPVYMREQKLNGQDSVKYKDLDKNFEAKKERWMSKSIVSEWMYEFTELARDKTGDEIEYEDLKVNEDEFVRILLNEEEKFDSLWSDGILLRQLIGSDNALRLSNEADSAINIVTDKFLVSFSNYSMKIMLPGKVIKTNGFIDSAKVATWPVISEYFLTESYVMEAESKLSNIWAWILSGLFILFLLAGVLGYKKIKG